MHTLPVTRRPAPGAVSHWSTRAVQSLALVFFAVSLGGCQTTAPLQPSTFIIDNVHDKGTALAFNRDRRPAHRILASAGTEGSVRLWRVVSGEPLRSWQAHDGPVYGLTFLGSTDRLLTGGYDGALREWSASGSRLRSLDTPSPITSLAVSKGTVLTGHDDGHVRLWRLADFKLLRDLPLHRGEVHAVAMHDVSGLMASSGSDGNVFFWRDAGAAQKLPAPRTDAQALTFSPDGQWLTGSGWFNLFQWRLDRAALTVLPTPHHGIVKSIQYTPLPNILASISRETDSSVYFLDARNGQAVRQFAPHDLCGGTVRVSPDGRYLATTSDDQSVRIWDLRAPATVTTMSEALPVDAGLEASRIAFEEDAAQNTAQQR